MKPIIINEIDTGVELERYPEQLPTEQKVCVFEQHLGFQLPDDYRAFLLKYNGGTCKFGSVIEPIDSVLCDLYCFDTHGQYGCMPLKLPKDCEEWEGLPRNILLIGETDSGAAVGILFEEGTTTIVVIDHEMDFSQEQIIMRSPSFTQFLVDLVRNED
jgi:hypothetical protein